MTIDNDDNATTTIEVCQGEGCFCSGGGAVLLELEELVSTAQQQLSDDETTRIDVVPGVCRHFCNMGPNVYYQTNKAAIQQKQQQLHFNNVKSLDDCQEFGKAIGLVVLHHEEDNDNGGSIIPQKKNDDIIYNMLYQRSRRLQWQVLRDMARMQQKKQTNNNNKSSTKQKLMQQVKDAFQAELAAAAKSNTPKLDKDRAEKRWEWLREKIRSL
mmetsp:Transcript_11865/g.17419  ORF Transcript_11865/g.17419 Transcript_11865/m.17419 type:complete len:213 (+) Transcript_11865:136-774(+)|eukprot:CAMPEP_0194223530 /NCGR_PEP_ID=MMETSP0156-20130528/35358_1 /TAXON_ID=33649 /ORGANISM="Thalassionema nitzschioides, Strain L26-B" /LENGTH=212 /DNA_ID=CAMNT_0038954719 /DNA_START=57 /DNA_END=695 /DNA_ORIENTATION=+